LLAVTGAGLRVPAPLFQTNNEPELFMDDQQDTGEACLGIVRQFDAQAVPFGFIDFCEWTGSIYFHVEHVIGTLPSVGSPVTFRVGPGVKPGQQQALDVERLCPEDYFPGDARPDFQPADSAETGTGTVLSFDDARGYGHIRTAKGRLMVHHTGIAGIGFKSLRAGDTVSFKIESHVDSQGRRRTRATQVEVIEPGAAATGEPAA
jgi:CspA family cold shock protein